MFMNFVNCLISAISIFSLGSCNLEFVNRSDWGARQPKSVQYLSAVPSYIFIHHSFIPAACYNFTDCIKAMQWMQNFHMDDRKWDDIGYSFAVGSDGRVYEGRGWNRVGAHTLGYNSVGLGFLVIGDYRFEIPNELAINSLKELITYAVDNNKVVQNYTLRGHRDVKATDCPGQAFYDIIRTWPHY